MVNEKTKKILYIVLIITAVIYFIFALINYIYEVNWQKENRAYELKYKEILERAIETKDVNLCKNHNFRLKCVVEVGKSLNDISVCSEFYSKELQIETCIASILDDESYCENNLTDLNVKTCKESLYGLKNNVQII